ncbi:MAG: hypothetical protein MR852_11660 [Treponema sp.]|nr:hypothetical protein [Treponema sp.]
MAKEVTYGKTFGIFYDAYRQFCRQYSETGKPTAETPEMFRQWFITNFVSSVDDATCCQLFLRDLNHELTHVYLRDENLMDFFKAVDIRDLEGLKTYIKDNGESVVLNRDDELENLTTGINFGICLHIPRMSQGYVFAYSLYDITNELRIFVNHGMDQYHISSNEIEDKKSIVYTDEEINLITRLAINLISYIYCFPDCLVDGAPHDVKTENNHYLNTSEKVLDVTVKAEAGLVIPHFRRGYFKHLTSDFYKNKKGQIVFVHETIVNGTAKTLENN